MNCLLQPLRRRVLSSGIDLHTPALCAETPNLPSTHRNKLAGAESHRLGCRLRLYSTRGSDSCIPEPLMGKHGELPDLGNLEDVPHSLHFFPSSGLHVYDNSCRKCKLGRGWLLNFSSCYSTTTYPPSFNICWGGLQNKIITWEWLSTTSF